MKKISCCISLMSCFCILSALDVVQADSKGSLQLNTTIITNQSASTSSVSDFEIRGQLFSPELTQKIQDKAKQIVNADQVIQEIDFSQKSQNKLYQTNFKQIKTTLFKAQHPALPSSKTTKTQANNKGIIILLIFAIPLIVSSGFIARWFVRRKRRR